MINELRNTIGFLMLRLLSMQEQSKNIISKNADSKQILVLVHEGESGMRDVGQRLERFFKKTGNDVTLLGYFPDKNEHPEIPYSHFNDKALNWFGRPRGEMIDAFQRRNWRYVIVLSSNLCLPLNWFIQNVGSPTIGSSAFDKGLRIALEGNESPGALAGHIEKLWQTLNTHVYAIA